MASYSKSSPYSKTGITNGYLDVLSFIDIPAYADDVQFLVTNTYAHRPDLLAYEIYGDVGLWWVFAVRNKEIIKDSIYDMVAGQVIYIPKLSTIKRAMGIT